MSIERNFLENIHASLVNHRFLPHKFFSLARFFYNNPINERNKSGTFQRIYPKINIRRQDRNNKIQSYLSRKENFCLVLYTNTQRFQRRFSILSLSFSLANHFPRVRLKNWSRFRVLNTYIVRIYISRTRRVQYNVSRSRSRLYLTYSDLARFPFQNTGNTLFLFFFFYRKSYTYWKFGYTFVTQFCLRIFFFLFFFLPPYRTVGQHPRTYVHVMHNIRGRA